MCYLTGWHRDGVGDKIGAALEEWAAVGHEPTLFLLNPRSPSGERRALGGQSFLFSTPAERLQATRRMYAAVRESKPDVIYLRYDLFFPPATAVTKVAPTVAEFNSNSKAEWGNRSKGAVLYGQFQERLLLRRLSGAVCVAHELGASVREKRPGLPVRVIGNGIALDHLPELPPPATQGIRLAYLGDDVYWQGIDKLFELAEALPDWQFDLIGVPPERSTANVTGHGYLEPGQYEPILAQADIAVGTLALMRRGMDETSTLKVPRYLAYGLPVIIGYEETDFVGEEPPWYLLRLPNTESNVRDNLDRIRAFATAVKGRRVDRAETAARFSTQVKEAARLSFLAEFARRS